MSGTGRAVAAHRTIVLFDVEGFTDPARTNADQAVVREALYTCVRNAFHETGIDWEACYHEDRGDGMLLLLPADVPNVRVVDPLTDRVLSELNWHNGVLADRNRIGVRMAVHAGEVWFDEHGVSGHAVNHTFRLLDADPLRTALARSRAPLALIASDRFFSDVIRHDRRARPDSFSTVRVRVKNTDGTGWLRCFDDPLPGGVPPGAGQTAAVFDMPARHRNFTGRDRELQALRRALLAEQQVGTAAVAVHGLGGVGKSRLVVEYAYRYQVDYDVVCWVPAGNPVSLRAHLARLGRKLTGSDHFAPAEEVMSTLWDAMRDGRRWLLVYDDADDPAELSRYWPRGRGHVLITSRNPAWSALAVPFRLQVLSRFESVEFLRRSTGERDHARLARLAALVGDLPLALEQARAYMEITSTSTDDYLRLLVEHERELLDLGVPVGDTPTVAGTWQLSLRRLRAEAPGAEQLLHLCAFLTPQGTSRDLLVEHGGVLPEELRRIVEHPIRFDAAVGAISRYSLATSVDGRIGVHVLMQRVIRHFLTQEERLHWLGVAVRLADAAMPGNVHELEEASGWPAFEPVLSLALAVVSQPDAAMVDRRATLRLLMDAAHHLRWTGDLAHAVRLQQRALAIRQERPERAAIADVLFELGRSYRELGEWEQARSVLEQALEIRVGLHGPRSAAVAEVITTLGLALFDGDLLDAARAMLEKAVSTMEGVPDHDPLQLSSALSVLGLVQWRQLDLEPARATLQRVLDTRRSHLRPDHPSVATALDNLAKVVFDQGDSADAESLNRRALEIRHERFGPRHPHVAISLNHLGSVLRERGDLTGALAAHEQAQAIFTARFGAEHSHVARSLEGRGRVLLEQGRFAEARQLLGHACEVFDKVLGPGHGESRRCHRALESAKSAGG